MYVEILNNLFTTSIIIELIKADTYTGYVSVRNKCLASL